ncbi:MAG: FAD-dependent oxidoreductase [Anaerolineales bacterium]|nr:FAD-dependent oxidoreductase [Anaerolineales bacterium]
MSRTENRLSRRAFLKRAAAGTAAVAGVGVLVGCDSGASAVECPPCQIPGVPETWDEEVDVVVIGAGMAGLCAALEAHEAGANVLVLNKEPDLNTSATAVCMGWISGAGTKYQKENPGTYEGVISSDKDTPDLFYEDVLRAGLNDPEMVRTFADNAGKNIDWLMDLGMEVDGYVTATLEWQQALHIHDTVGPSGMAYINVLGPALEERNIPILFSTPAVELISDAEGRIIGVEAESNGEKKFIRAKATVIATGSYTGSPEMIDLYEPQAKGAVAAAPSCSSGDGLRMAAKKGAVITHTGITTYSMKVALTPGGRAFGNTISLKTQIQGRDGVILVNLQGQRFANEENKQDAGRNVQEQQDRAWFSIFDENIKEIGINRTGSDKWVSGWDAERWQEELDTADWVIRADTIAQLAEKAGIDSDGLEETVAQYNSYVDAGQDPDHGRTPESLAKIETAPFYAIVGAVTLMPVGCGGLNINTKTQVIDVDGEIIPGLYAAGAVAAPKVHGRWALCGHSTSMGCTFGRIAGQNAAVEQV